MENPKNLVHDDLILQIFSSAEQEFLTISCAMPYWADETVENTQNKAFEWIYQIIGL